MTVVLDLVLFAMWSRNSDFGQLSIRQVRGAIAIFIATGFLVSVAGLLAFAFGAKTVPRVILFGMCVAAFFLNPLLITVVLLIGNDA